jgi:error-prone DNA polymerase
LIFCSSHFSFLRSPSSPEELANRAAELGLKALCLVDVNGVYGAVRHQRACRARGLKPLIGCTVMVGGMPTRIVARNRRGYASMNQLLTQLHSLEQPVFETAEPLRDLQDCYVLAVGEQDLEIPSNTSIGRCVALSLLHSRRPGQSLAADRMVRLARKKGLPVCIAPFINYARRDEYMAYDVMTCTRLGITIFDPHPERPVNDEECLKSEDELHALLPFPEAFSFTHKMIDDCEEFDVLPGHVTPPRAQVPDTTTPENLLSELCTSALLRKYRNQKKAVELLKHELEVICHLKLADFFLVVKEIVDEARRRGIRYSGRGSAANSIVAYLLDITGVCPIRHNLLFERFLHRGRKGTPDIDVDFDSDRRHEIIAWMEQRFGREQTAMTATLITYRARMAVRDAAKALGWSIDIVNKLSKSVPGFTNKDIADFTDNLREALDASRIGKNHAAHMHVPLLDVLLRVVEKLLDHPRHLGQHSGGMILSSKPLTYFTPVQRSANGVSVVQFDKDDVEAMGLVKFDVLGLRMLACISEALELITYTQADDLGDTDARWQSFESLDDSAVYELIRSGQTLGVFQIESQGQMHLLAQHQPETFDDLVTEVALFRPGPLQGGMVNPYIRRRRGLEPVRYIHSDLEPLLKDTLGIVLFQEQVLDIAHHFAGMPLDEADDFRALVSKNRDAKAMEAMHEKFVKGAMQRGVDKASAELVYEKVSHFVGYGFCRSHAAAFAKIVYQSAWLKHYYPAAYMAAFMQHRPGMYNLMTLEEEAKRFGVPVLPPDINRSGTRYSLSATEHAYNAAEREGNASMPRLGIQKPLTSIKLVTEDMARMIVWERATHPFKSADDVVARVSLSADVYDSIALSGALDSLEGNARRALWIVSLLSSNSHKNANVGNRQARDAQQRFSSPAIAESLIPLLPPIKAPERLAYDYMTHGAARIHPMALYRRMLTDFEIRPIEMVWSLPALSSIPPVPLSICVAGIVILRQSPPTAHGVLFVTIEDETGFVQCVVQPREREIYERELRHAALIVKADVVRIGNAIHGTRQGWRGLVVREVRILNNVIGGYSGHLQMYGGLDTQALGFGDNNNTSEDHGHSEHEREGKFFAIVQDGHKHSK